MALLQQQQQLQRPHQHQSDRRRRHRCPLHTPAHLSVSALLVALLTALGPPHTTALRSARSVPFGGPSSSSSSDHSIRELLRTQSIEGPDDGSTHRQRHAFEIHPNREWAFEGRVEQGGHDSDGAMPTLIGPPQPPAFEGLVWQHLEAGAVPWGNIDPAVTERFERRMRRGERTRLQEPLELALELQQQGEANNHGRRLLSGDPKSYSASATSSSSESHVGWHPASAPLHEQRAFLDHLLAARESPLRPVAQTASFANSNSSSSTGRLSRRELDESVTLPPAAPAAATPPVSVDYRGVTPPGLNSGPSPADINMTAFRYDSVVVRAWVDWRMTRFVTPVASQIKCESCWALTATDSVALMWGIATFARESVQLSAQQACDCAAGQCCHGGWPEWVMAYIVYNGGIASEGVYPYRATDQPTCDAEGASVKEAQITGWELVPAYDVQAMMQAVSQQPIIAFVDASSADFKSYRGGFYNGNCSSDVNHALLLVGYGTSASNGPYWIAKNTWGRNWGDRGYMYLAMTAGAGKCGINQIPPIYPVFIPKAPPSPLFPIGPLRNRSEYAPSTAPWWLNWAADPAANPCRSRINPCGSGACLVQNGLARCLCPRNFVERIGAPTSKCVSRDPCRSLGGVVNPCGAGVCNNVRATGLYSCSCSAGYAIGARAEGSPTCVPVTPDGGSLTYTTVYGDTCERLSTAFTLPPASFSLLNPFLDCSQPLPPGLTLAVSNPSEPTTSGCSATNFVSPADTCASLSLRHFRGDEQRLRHANPGLDCDALYVQQQVCTQALGRLSQQVSPLVCGLTYSVEAGDSCASIGQTYAINETKFFMLNPGLDCSLDQLPTGLTVCVGEKSARDLVSCTKWYLVQQGDNCPNIWNGANLTLTSFLAINPGIRCEAPHLQVGQLICIASPEAALVDSLPSSSRPSLLPYTVQTNDTLTSVAMAFFHRCGTNAGEANLCHANNLFPCDSAALSAGQVLLVPCSRRVGVNDCGCSPPAAASLVCGSDFSTYPSTCEATCNDATPVTPGACTPCQSACYKRSGLMADTRFQGRCRLDLADTYCPFPAWPPTGWRAMASSACQFEQVACEYVCTDTANTLARAQSGSRWAAFRSQCLKQCMCTPRVPCGKAQCTAG